MKFILILYILKNEWNQKILEMKYWFIRYLLIMKYCLILYNLSEYIEVSTINEVTIKLEDGKIKELAEKAEYEIHKSIEVEEEQSCYYCKIPWIDICNILVLVLFF